MCGKFRRVKSRSTNLFVISLGVGVIAAVAGRLFTWLVMPRFGMDFGVPAYAYQWISPLVLFGSAAAAFAITFGAMPWTGGRARRAALVAAVLTYICHAMWVAGWGTVTGNWPMLVRFLTLLFAFIVVGWVPILSALFAGWCVERWLGIAPAAAMDDRHPSDRAAVLMFGFVGALVSLPLLFPLLWVALPSRVGVPIFFVTEPIVVFILAAVWFRVFLSLLPKVAFRPQWAGGLAAACVFFCFLFWIRYAINIRSQNGAQWDSLSKPFVAASVLVGWVPLVFGTLAGGWASRWLKKTPKPA